MYDREYFFRCVRDWDSRLSQSQVDGFLFLLGEAEKFSPPLLREEVAYLLATVWHETCKRMQPISEIGGPKYFDGMYDPVLGKDSKRRAMARANGNTKRGSGRLYHGRGYVQITWFNNYKRLGDRVGVDLIANPEKALDPNIAWIALATGMKEGWYGHKLSEYISSRKCDYRGARRCVNGTDKDTLVASYAMLFDSCLKTSS